MIMKVIDDEYNSRLVRDITEDIPDDIVSDSSDGHEEEITSRFLS